jgi:hypothetical protein
MSTENERNQALTDEKEAGRTEASSDGVFAIAALSTSPNELAFWPSNIKHLMIIDEAWRR